MPAHGFVALEREEEAGVVQKIVKIAMKNIKFV